MNAIDRKCPTCRAAPGAPCVRVNGKGARRGLAGFHPARRGPAGPSGRPPSVVARIRVDLDERQAATLDELRGSTPRGSFLRGLIPRRSDPEVAGERCDADGCARLAHTTGAHAIWTDAPPCVDGCGSVVGRRFDGRCSACADKHEAREKRRGSRISLVDGRGRRALTEPRNAFQCAARGCDGCSVCKKLDSPKET